MRSVNKVILIGNLTRDPELRQTPNGQSVVTFSIATNREWITKDGKKHSMPEFHDLVAWAKLADICHQHLKKGKLIYVEGYLKTRAWETPEGVKKFRTEIVVQDLIMLDKRNHADQDEYIPEEFEEETISELAEAIDTERQNAPSQPQTKANEAVVAPQTPTDPKLIDIDQDLGL